MSSPPTQSGQNGLKPLRVFLCWMPCSRPLMRRVVTLADCEIYGYLPDSEADPLPDRGAIWSFNFLFYNRKLKRIVTFRLSCFSNLLADGFSFDEMLDEYDEEIFANMDI
ncbi:hypothetical protein TSUD_49160 [Trifolium subterraneum]|uniref:Repressor of RNA polymerase III transcription n=1 Tax=Trifolium subterraneum TaxID=3900 RepID=A0A2Z6N562_TRISU|nr:hypothetical protein TSUD_49160 [Trifolium subterraneum]